MLDGSRQDGPGRENLFGTLAHHPVLAHAWLSLARVLTHEGALGHRRRELIVLRVAHRLDAPYVHRRHRTPATDAGLTEAEIDATAAELGTHPWRAEDRDLLEAADLLAVNSPLPDGLWDRLARALRADQLVELLVLAGQTATMCTTLNTLRTPSDADTDSTAQQPSLTVLLDRDRCCSAGQCVGAAPEVFEQDEADGRVALLVPDPDARYAEEVRFAADLCPGGAITLLDHEETVHP
ncbi:ferredoxin [Streptomyces sp. MBT65]|nr:ferredoxin [Streptomyces sp. MBT65]